MNYLLSDCLIIAKREIIRGLREKSRLYGSIMRPLIWLFILGNGLRPSFSNLGINYLHYIFPGILVMNIQFASIMAGTSIIWDREFGFLKEILVAPVSRISIALGKTLGGSMISLIQGLIVFIMFPFIGIKINLFIIHLILLYMFFFAFAITSLGILIAVRMRSFEGFGIMNNFVIMPMFFLSGAMYPVEKAPAWIKTIIKLNPVHYGVDLIRSAILNIPSQNNLFLNLGFLGCFTVIISGIAIFFFIKDQG